MKIIPMSVEVMYPEEIDASRVYPRLEIAARTCYKSEDRIGPGSAEKLLKFIMKRGHLSVLEHEKVTVKFTCDRGVTHELVRHRIASYSQESTRYCDYDGELQVIDPLIEDQEVKCIWEAAMEKAEIYYKNMRKWGSPPEIARHVLPLSVKTEIVATMNLRQWLQVFKLRTSPKAHPHIRKLMRELFDKFEAGLPVIFNHDELMS